MEQARQPIRVLHITFNMGIGGTEQVIRQLVSQMPETEAVSSILCIDGMIGPLGQSLQNAGVEVVALKRSPGFDRQLIRQIRERIRDGRFDLVHCHQYTPFIYGRLAAIATGARVVFTEHGRFYPDRYRYKAAPVNWLLAIITPAIVAISSATRDALSRYEFIPAWKIRVIYNGIKELTRNAELEAAVRCRLGIPESAFVVGTVSRLDSVKNQKMMIGAFKRFLEASPDSYLLMVGDGPERDALEKQTEKAGLAGRILFTGYIEHPASYLAAMDAFLLSSYTEGTSMTLLEAMSLGIPTVATRVGGNPEIVSHGETGLLAQSDDEAGFAGAMVRIFKDPGLREKLSRNSQARFKERFTVSHMAEQYLNLYTHIVGS